MDIDLQALQTGLMGVASALWQLKKAKDLLPEGADKKEIENEIEQAERKLKLAEAQIAPGLGYEICRNHWPPGIMVSEEDEVWKCQDCGNTRDTRIRLPPVKGFTRKSRWKP